MRLGDPLSRTERVQPGAAVRPAPWFDQAFLGLGVGAGTLQPACLDDFAVDLDAGINLVAPVPGVLTSDVKIPILESDMIDTTHGLFFAIRPDAKAAAEASGLARRLKSEHALPGKQHRLTGYT